MSALRFSFFQLTFGQPEAYKQPEKTYERLKRYGYDAIELTPPKGRYGLGVGLDEWLETHKKLTRESGLAVSCLNECWGEMWDPFSATTQTLTEGGIQQTDSPQVSHKTLTEPQTAAKAIAETKITIDCAAELGAPFVTVAVAIHETVTKDNVLAFSKVAIDTLRQMCAYAKEKGIKLVFEATNHLEMGKYVNTVANHKRLIEKTGCDNLGIQIDWFHAGFEELNPYEAIIDAQPLLWHLHLRDTNSLIPGMGNTDWKAVIRALKKTNYEGYCTIESAPMIPDSDTAAQIGIDYLTMMERIAEYQISPEFPNGFAVV